MGFSRCHEHYGLAAAARAGRRYHIERRHFFFHQGEPARWLYLVVEGQVKLPQVTPEGHQVILRLIGSGEAFGLIAIMGESKYSISAQVVDDCLGLRWDGDEMGQMLKRYPQLAFNAMSVLSAYIRELQKRYRELATERVERRIARSLLRLARQTGQKVEDHVVNDMPLSRQNLAEMTGTTGFTFSRILSRWEQQGLIKAGRQRIINRQRHGMTTIAEDLPPLPLQDDS